MTDLCIRLIHFWQGTVNLQSWFGIGVPEFRLRLTVSGTKLGMVITPASPVQFSVGGLFSKLLDSDVFGPVLKPVIGAPVFVVLTLHSFS